MLAAFWSAAQVFLRPTTNEGRRTAGLRMCRHLQGARIRLPRWLPRRGERELAGGVVLSPDVPLEDPHRADINTPFSPTPPRKWYSWRPKSRLQEDSPAVARLAEQVARLRQRGLTPM